MLRILVITLLALPVVVTAAGAQTATTTQSSTTQSTGTTTSSPNEGAFSKLSPGNQKIAQALYEAQQTNAQPSGASTSSTSTAPKTYTLDDIAALKQSGQGGWGKIFKQMKAEGHFPDAKNLGQLVSGKYQPQSGTSGSTTITSASGKSQVAGKPGKGHLDDGASSGQDSASVSSSSGRGYGHGSSSGPSASAGRGSSSGHGGRGK